MSGITLVFGGNLEADGPQGPDDAAELGEDNLSKKWPLEESLYIKVFKGTRFQPTVGLCRRAPSRVATCLRLFHRLNRDYFGV